MKRKGTTIYVAPIDAPENCRHGRPVVLIDYGRRLQCDQCEEERQRVLHRAPAAANHKPEQP